MAELPTQRDFEDYSAWSGRDVLTSGGDRLGAVDLIFLDEATDLPEWVLVRLEDGEGSAFVPLAGASVEERAIRVDADRERIAAAPRLDAGETLSVADERRLYEHYGLPHSQTESSTVLPEGAATGTGTAADTTQERPAEERPRLRRYVGAPVPPPASPDAAAEGAPPAPAGADAAPAGETTPTDSTDDDAASDEEVPIAAAATAGAAADPDRTEGPAPSDGPTTTGTGAVDPAPTPLPPPAPTPLPPEGGFQGGTSGGAEDEGGGPLAALKRRPAIPVAIAGAIAGLIAVLALRRRR